MEAKGRASVKSERPEKSTVQAGTAAAPCIGVKGKGRLPMGGGLLVSFVVSSQQQSLVHSHTF